MRTRAPIALAAVVLVGLSRCVLAQPQSGDETQIPSEPYTWQNVVIGGGGFVTGIIFHPHQKDLMYVRTDVGGAYRWDATLHRWIPLTDWIGASDVNLTGIESLAVDASDPDRLYLAAGTYSRGEAAILRSDDQGKTFERTDVPFKMGGNESGRFNGERLAVDPNDGSFLFFGSRHDGLWKSADRGVTWQKVETFPEVGASESPGEATDSRRSFSRFGRQAVGVVCVLFDPSSGAPGRATPTIYAAVSATQTNVYRSADAGATWQPLPGQPLGLCPNHLIRGADGILYLTYGKEPGPNTMTDGAVWKYNPTDAAWTDITPVKPAEADQLFGYGAVTVDAQHPATLMVSTFCHWKPHDEIYRSTNGGSTWTALLHEAEWDYSFAPYTRTRKPHWMGDVEINPFNSDQVIFTTGYGLWSCRDVTQADHGAPTHWEFLDAGLEETVPLALISPPEGAHLLSGVGDIDGFRHDDLSRSPSEGSFAGPRFSNTEDMEFAGQSPSIIVRAGTGSGNRVRAAISLDGGKSWSALATEPPGSDGAGTITVSADGKRIVWTPRRRLPYVTADRGTHWRVCGGLAYGTQVVADRVNPGRFYAYDGRRGHCLVSTNGAASFSASESALPAADRFAGAAGFGRSSGQLSVTPGVEGDLWLALNTGLYHSADSGASFTKTESVDRARWLGYGKAPPGKQFPTLYLVGRVRQLEAVFRSTDAGATWVRINDDTHQYGYISRITGDPRIFGRVYLATGGRGIIYGDQVQVQGGL